MTGAWLLTGLVVVLLGLSAFFVAAEFSLVSARRTVIEPLAVTSRRARITLRAMEDVSVMMACAQLGITVCGVLLGALGEPAVAKLLEPVFHSVGVPEGWLHPVALVIALLLVVGAHVALGEMVPKNVALAGPESTAMLLAPVLRGIATMLGPVVRGLNGLANAVVKLTGHEPKDEVNSSFTRDEVAGLVTESRAEGLLGGSEHTLITSALEFSGVRIAQVLVPDAEVVSLPEGVSAAEVERTCARTGFSRFPIRDAGGRYVGYLHIRDVVGIPAEQRDAPVPPARIRRLPVVPSDAGLRFTLERMRQRGAHMAQVGRGTGAVETAAESAGPAPEPADRLGLLMLEDVLEELIGEVRDATRRSV